MANQNTYSGSKAPNTAETAVLELVRLLARQAAQDLWAQQNATDPLDNSASEDSTFLDSRSEKR